MHSKAPGPLASHSIEGVPVRPAQLANLGLHADVAVGVGQQGLDGEEDLPRTKILSHFVSETFDIKPFFEL